ncbi:MAG: FHA domain-containing protein [Oscillospiraceae bacterium]
MKFIDEEDVDLNGFRQNKLTRLITKREKKRRTFAGLHVQITDLQMMDVKQCIIENTLTFGRENITNTESFYQVPYPTVSGNHCSISLLGDAVVVQDLKSRNGTYINDQCIQTHTITGSSFYLRLGSASLKIEFL